MRLSILHRAVLLLAAATIGWIGLGGLSIARAQMPAPAASPEAADIAHCLCLRQALDGQSAALTTRQQTLDGLRGELSRLDAQMQRERATMDVNNPNAVARFRQLLDQRDVIFRRLSGPATAEADAATRRYNTSINEYNARCANRPRDPYLLAQIQATLVCPPPR